MSDPAIGCAKTPLSDLLRRIPQDAVYNWTNPEEGRQLWQLGSESAPIGRLAHEAADALDATAWNRRTPVAPVSREEIARIIGRAITAYEDNPSPDCKTAKTNACAAAAADTILAALGTKETNHD